MTDCINSEHQGVSICIEFDEAVYKPGDLTKTLCDIMEVKPGDRVIDIGCGTGYLGIVASLLGASEVIAIDPSPEALKCTLHNAKLNGVHNLTVRRGGALDPVVSEKADLILTLPPQMPYPDNFNPCRYGGKDGTDVILTIIKQAKQVLQENGGRFYLVHASLAYPQKIREALQSSRFSWEVAATVEKEFIPLELDNLAPGLSKLLLDYSEKGLAEIIQRGTRRFYPVWFYRVVPA